MSAARRPENLLCAYRLTNELDLKAATHSHDFHHLLYLIEGECEVTVDGCHVPMAQDRFLAIPPHTPHAMRFPSSDRVRCDVIQIKASLPGKLADLLPTRRSVDCSSYALEMTSALNLIVRTLERRPSRAARAFASLLAYVAVILAECGAGEAAPAGPTASDARIKVAVTHLDSAFKENCSTRKLAKIASLNESYFIRLFKRHVGMPPSEYLIKKRLDAAASMLIFSSARVADIASAVGYGSYNHFSCQFKKHFGVSPKDYRSESAKNGGAS